MLGEVQQQLTKQLELVDAITGVLGEQFNGLKAPIDKTTRTLKKAATTAARNMVKGTDYTQGQLIRTMGDSAGRSLDNQQSVVDQVTSFMMTVPGQLRT